MTIYYTEHRLKCMCSVDIVVQIVNSDENKQKFRSFSNKYIIIHFVLRWAYLFR